MAFRFESLDIWDQARAYASKVYPLSAKFPRHEDFGLRSQINRAVSSISLNIAEGSGKNSNKHFDLYLDNAVASTFETVSASFLAVDRGYITSEEHQMLYAEGEKLARRINAFRKTLR